MNPYFYTKVFISMAEKNETTIEMPFADTARLPTGKRREITAICNLLEKSLIERAKRKGAEKREALTILAKEVKILPKQI